MSLLIEEEDTGAKQRHIVEIRPSRRVIVTRPGSEARLSVHVASSRKEEIRLIVEELEPSIASHTLAPEQGQAPFTSTLKLLITPNAAGVYPFRLAALSTTGGSYGATNLVLVILPHQLSPEILDYLQQLLAYYKSYGIQYVIWYLLAHLYKDKGMSFTEIKSVYEFLKKRKLSNGTVGDLVERMERKGIIVKRETKYYAGVEDEKLVLDAIDVKRMRSGRKGAKRLLETLTTGEVTDSVIRRGSTSEEYTPLVVRKVLSIAEKLIRQGQTGKALGLLPHTVINVRKTGRWILWARDNFIYRERKAKPKLHYFRSRKLAEILQNMGLRQGFIHPEPVDDIIHNMFPGGYREARRIHYILKSIGWITYGPPIIMYIAVYSNGTGGFKIEDLDKKMLLEVNYDPRKAIKIIKNLVMPEEHVDRSNDETYFKYK